MNTIESSITFRPVTFNLFNRHLVGRKRNTKCHPLTATRAPKANNTEQTAKMAKRWMVSLRIAELIVLFWKSSHVLPKIHLTNLSCANLSQFKWKIRWSPDRPHHRFLTVRHRLQVTPIRKFRPFQVYPLSISVVWQWVGKNCDTSTGKIPLPYRLHVIYSLFRCYWCGHLCDLAFRGKKLLL